MSESSTSGPLSTGFNLSGVKTGRPIIADGHLCHARLADIEVTNNGKGDRVVFEWHLLDPAPDTEGRQLKPGFSLKEGIVLYGSDTPPGVIPERAIISICKRVDALLGTGDPGNNKNKPARPDFPGSSIQERVANMALALVPKETFFKVKAKTGEFEGNDITTFMFPGDMQG